METMRVAEIWRHPVKSLRGERITSGRVEDTGLAFDRVFGIRDLVTGHILTGRREPALLLAAASIDESDGSPVIVLPDGQALRGTGDLTDAGLSDFLGHPVGLVAAASTEALSAEAFADATDDSSAPFAFTMPEGRYVDVSPLLLLTTASLRAAALRYPGGDWDVRRFRPNLLIEADGDGFVEDTWIGGTGRIGEVELSIAPACIRCTMVTRPQDGLERDLEIFKTLSRDHSATFGVWTMVSRPGVVHEGDEVMVTPAAA
jgi:hypothetical protein